MKQNKYYIKYRYKNINIDINLRAVNQEEAIRKLHGYLEEDIHVDILEVKIGV